MVFLGFYLVLDLSCCVSYQLIWKFEVFFTCFKLGYDMFVVVLIHGCHNTPPCLKVHSIVIMAIYTFTSSISKYKRPKPRSDCYLPHSQIDECQKWGFRQIMRLHKTFNSIKYKQEVLERRLSSVLQQIDKTFKFSARLISVLSIQSQHTFYTRSVLFIKMYILMKAEAKGNSVVEK